MTMRAASLLLALCAGAAVSLWIPDTGSTPVPTSKVPSPLATRLLEVLTLQPRAAYADEAPSPAAGHVPVHVTTAVEPRRVTIGTPFRYTMRIEAEKDVELVVPTLAGQIGEFQVTDFGAVAPHEEQGHTVVERWYTLLTYTAGDHIVPGPTVQYRTAGSDLERIAAPDALVIVQSLLDTPEGQKADDVHDIKGPVAVPHDYRPLLWLAGALLAMGGAIAAIVWLVRRRRRVAIVVPRPAHELAIEALVRLHAARLLESGRHAEFYVRLSAIVREYLEARFHLRAPEMTTEEFLQVAQRDPQLTPAQRSLLGQFLSEADLVKFARYTPSADDAERAYRAAREFVESTAIREAPRAAA